MKAIILSRRDFRENDQIISLYTADRGKVEALARGVKKILSKNSAALEPFCFIEAEIIPGREILHLGSVTPINIYQNIRADLSASLAAGYAMDLVDKIVHVGEADLPMFELIKTWLEWIDTHTVIPTETAMAGEWRNRLKPLIVPILDLRDPSTSLGMTGRFLTAFIAKFLTLLGFDPSALSDNIELLVHGSWQTIGALNFKLIESERIQKQLYHFALANLERKIGDWGKLAKIGGI